VSRSRNRPLPIDDIYLPTTASRFCLTLPNIELILRGTSIGQRRKKLQETARGNGLRDAYMAAI